MTIASKETLRQVAADGGLAAHTAALAAASQQAEERRFWSIVERKIKDIVARAMPHESVEVDSIQFPLFVPSSLPGLTTSIVVGFPCRIIGWTLVSVAGGAITVDIRRSTPLTHPTMSSLPGSSPLFPSLSGVYATSANRTPNPLISWVSIDLARGDILHCYVTASTGTWVDGTLALDVRRIA